MSKNCTACRTVINMSGSLSRPHHYEYGTSWESFGVPTDVVPDYPITREAFVHIELFPETPDDMKSAISAFDAAFNELGTLAGRYGVLNRLEKKQETQTKPQEHPSVLWALMSETDYESAYLIGVYSSRDAAKQAAKKHDISGQWEPEHISICPKCGGESRMSGAPTNPHIVCDRAGCDAVLEFKPSGSEDEYARTSTSTTTLLHVYPVTVE